MCAQARSRPPVSAPSSWQVPHVARPALTLAISSLHGPFWPGGCVRLAPPLQSAFADSPPLRVCLTAVHFPRGFASDWRLQCRGPSAAFIFAPRLPSHTRRGHFNRPRALSIHTGAHYKYACPHCLLKSMGKPILIADQALVRNGVASAKKTVKRLV